MRLGVKLHSVGVNKCGTTLKISNILIIIDYGYNHKVCGFRNIKK